ncbi:hypothetical protein [uncultured Eubacterium sp.]|uniref:hypothetical protein n=1 Tax=uncultured Eubacterium sp. TaxID=165185 RepID=UPI0025DDCE80|nr:hypothetical protein [uncultured Eubacterium sp.]
MKKIVSLIMSIVMLLSVLSSVNLSALASDESSSKQIKSATFVSSTVCEIYEGAYGGYDKTTGKGYYWAPHDFSDGDAINIEFSDGTTDTYTYEYVGFCNSDYSYLNLSYYSFYFDGLGETTAYILLQDYNYDLAIPVKIVENPVKSFSVIPSSKYEIMEKTHGYDNGGEWRYNSPYFKEGDKISVNYSNGTSKVYGISGSDSSTFYIYDDEVGKDVYVLEENNFSFNGTGETSFTVSLYEKNEPNGNNKLLATTSVPVTIIENTVASVFFSPIKPYKIIEKTNGYYEGESNNFVYYGPDFNVGDKLIVKYIDNTTKTYVYKDNNGRSGFYNNGERLCAYFEDNEKVTGLGKTTFKMTVDEYNVSKDVEVEIVENPIASISLLPIIPYEIIEKTNGYDDDESNSFVYFGPDFNEGDKLIVNYKDNTTKTYVFEYNDDEWDFYNNGERLRVGFEDNEKVTGLGKTTFKMILEEYNVSTDVEVEIVENPVKSFSVIPSSKYEIMEKTHGFDDGGEWRYNSPYFKEGDKISVNYSNGTSKVYKISGSDIFEFYTWEDDGNEYYLDSSSFSFDGTGETSFTVNFSKYDSFGKLHLLATASVPVTIIENPVASVSLSPIKPYKIMEKTNGYYEDESDNFVYHSPDFNVGDKLTVNYKDNTTKTYVYEENDDRTGFFNNNERLRAYFRSNEKVTGLGKTTFKLNVDELNISTDVEVEIVENPIASFELKPVKPYELYDEQHIEKNDNYYWWFYNPKFNNGDVITVNYKDGTTVDYTYSSSRYEFIDANSNILHVNEQSHLGFEVKKNNLSDAKFEITLNDYNKSIQYPVTIVESPVESVTLSPVKPYEIVQWTHGYDDNGTDWVYYPPYNEGDIVTVTYKTGEKIVYKFDGENFVDENNEILEIEDEINYFSGVGDATFYLTLAKYGNKTEYTVKIVSASPHTHIWSDWHYNNDAEYNSKTDYTDGTATRTCSECGKSETKTIVGTGLLRANSASVVLDASVTLNIGIDKSRTSPFESSFIRVEFGGESYDLTEPSAKTTTDRTYYDFDKISPEKFADEVTITPYGVTSDGIECKGHPVTYSIKNYCYTQLNKTPSQNLKSLLVELLYYGEEYQKYRGYNTDNLVTSDLTDEQKKLHTTDTLDYSNVANSKYQLNPNGIAKNEVNFKSASMLLEGKVIPRIKVEISSSTSINDYTFRWTVNGQNTEFTYAEHPDWFTQTNGSASDKRAYYVDCTVLKADQFSTPFYLTVFKNGTQVSNMLQYSVESYATGSTVKNNVKLKSLVDQMLRYGRAEKIRLGQSV